MFGLCRMSRLVAEQDRRADTLAAQLAAEMQAQSLMVAAKDHSEQLAKVTRTLALTTLWLTANLRASGRNHRTLTQDQLNRAMFFGVQASEGKDGDIRLTVVAKPPEGQKPVAVTQPIRHEPVGVES